MPFVLREGFPLPPRPFSFNERFEGGLPYRIKFCTWLGNFSNGVERSKSCASAPNSRLRFRNTEPEPGPNPPSNSGRDQSTMILAGSKSYFEPRPLHAGQAPYGELKLNDRGSSCGTEMPHSGQASFSEKTCSLPLTTATATRPCASFNAVSMDCPSRAAIPGLTSR